MMRKSFVALSIVISANSATTYAPLSTFAKQETPAYAEWGKLAIEETSVKYPNAEIVDYLHEGSESIGNSTIEKFKLWLKDGKHEFGVLVRITYITNTKKVTNIELRETSR